MSPARAIGWSLAVIAVAIAMVFVTGALMFVGAFFESVFR